MNKKLQELLVRAEAWPDAAQQELAELGFEIDEATRDGTYAASPEELAALDEAERGGIATAAEVEAAFAKFRRA